MSGFLLLRLSCEAQDAAAPVLVSIGHWSSRSADPPELDRRRAGGDESAGTFIHGTSLTLIGQFRVCEDSLASGLCPGVPLHIDSLRSPACWRCLEFGLRLFTSVRSSALISRCFA